MQKISYSVDAISGEIHWAASETFDELSGKSFSLGEMEAVKIEKMTDLTDTSKILLSAVAGAVIQRLIDNNIAPEQIFTVGTMEISPDHQLPSDGIISIMPR